MNQHRNNTFSETLNDNKISRLIEEAILEDIGMGDITTEATVSPEAFGRGEILVKEQGIIAGLEVASMVFRHVDPEMQFQSKIMEGSPVEKGTIVAVIEGSLHGILKGERTALNFLQRMSGIATLTHKFVDAVKGTKARITDTRKTVPGLRIVDKLAVKIGEGINHRFGLDDMVLVKDNHIVAAGGITSAIEQCHVYLSQKSYIVKVEVETKNLSEVKEVLQLQGVDRIMLDNFSIDEMRKAVQIINNKIEVEASGNVSLATVRAIAETGVDFISIGALTHSPKALDISLDLVPVSPGTYRPS